MKNALISMFLPLFLIGCASERIVEVPVPVEVIRTEYVPIPADLLAERHKQALPEEVTYGDALSLWAEDRTTIDVLLGQLKAISMLEP